MPLNLQHNLQQKPVFNEPLNFIVQVHTRHERDCFLILKEQDSAKQNGMITKISGFNIGFENINKTPIIEWPLRTVACIIKLLRSSFDDRHK